MTQTPDPKPQQQEHRTHKNTKKQQLRPNSKTTTNQHQKLTIMTCCLEPSLSGKFRKWTDKYISNSFLDTDSLIL